LATAGVSGQPDREGCTIPLSEEALAFWRSHGYLIIKRCIDDPLVSLLRKSLAQATVPSDVMPYGKGIQQSQPAFRVRSLLTYSERFDILIDLPPLVSVVRQLAGDYAYLMSVEGMRRFPQDGPGPILNFHTDSGAAMQGIRFDPWGFALQLKIQVFLTDVLSDDCGNFMLVDGSHTLQPRATTATSSSKARLTLDEANHLLTQSAYPPRTVQLRAEAGDAVVFPWTLWHGVARNRSR
jgi:hypothetical protein